MSAFIMRSRGSRVVWGCLARPVDPHLVVDLHLWRGAESHADLAQKRHYQTAVMLTDGPARVFVSQQMNEFGELDIGARRQCRQAFSIEPWQPLFDRKQMGRPGALLRPPEAICGHDCPSYAGHRVQDGHAHLTSPRGVRALSPFCSPDKQMA